MNIICKNCGASLVKKPAGRMPEYCSQSCKDKWRYYNNPKRIAHREKTRDMRRETGYHKNRYANDTERQRERSLAYYYENRERILAQKREMDITTEACAEALDLIEAGKATREDAMDWAEVGLGYKNDRIEEFIVSQLEDAT